MKKKVQKHTELDVDSIGNQTERITPQEEQEISEFIRLRKERMKKLKDKKREKA